MKVLKGFLYLAAFSALAWAVYAFAMWRYDECRKMGGNESFCFVQAISR